MIVQQEMANVKLKQHMIVQSLVSSFMRLCCFVIHCACMCHLSVYLCAWCCLNQSTDITGQYVQCSRDPVAEGRWLSASLYEAVLCNNISKPVKVSCTLIHHDSTCLLRSHRSNRISPAASRTLVYYVKSARYIHVPQFSLMKKSPQMGFSILS